MKMHLLPILLVLLLDKSQAKPSANAEPGVIREDLEDLVAVDNSNEIGETLDEKAKDDKTLEEWYSGAVDNDNILDADPAKFGQDTGIATIIAEKNEISNRNHKIAIHQGDILYPVDEKGDEINEKRNARRPRSALWHSKTIYYQLDNTITTNDKAAIKAGIADYHSKTCIKFVEQRLGATDKYFVKFFKGGGCYSYMGKVKGARGFDKFQPISIGRGCGYKGIVIHECMHMLGFFHEQSRYDRDDFLQIYWNNIPDSWKSQFRKATKEDQDTLGAAYDYDGVMHYGKTLFGKQVMAAKVNGKVDQSITLGQRNGFSKIDLDQINALYDCSSSATKGQWSAWSKLSPCLAGNKKTKQRFCYSDNPNSCTVTNQPKVTTRSGVQTFTTDCSTTAGVDGKWGSWSPYAACSKTCGGGIQLRSRRCNNPAPSNGGAACAGLSTGTKNCNNKACPGPGPGPVVGQWETWSNWGSCTKQQRVRKCTSKGSPASNCPGDSIATKDCSNNCKVDGKFGSWSAWTRCTVSCGGGKQRRTRRCDNPPSQNGGAPCTGDLVENQNCNVGACPAVTAAPTNRPPTDGPRTDGPRPTGSIGQDTLSCSFANGACNWIGTTAIKWVSSKASPIGDHTTEKDYFLELKSASGKAGDIATAINSGMVSDGTPKCFELFYYMYGAQMGTLDISAVYGGVTKNLLSIKGNRGNQWNQATAEVNVPAGTTFKIQISGTLGGSVGSNMGIDDLLLWNGGCPAANKIPTPSGLRCAFETGICNWRQLQSDKFDWTRKKGTTPSSRSNTGPKESSTGPNDFYLYIEASFPRNDKDNAIIQSPEIASRTATCLKFKYNMYGTDISKLIVWKIDSSDYSRKVLWTKSGGQGVKWLSAEVNLPQNEGIKVEIEALRGKSFKGDIAIDEIQVEKGKC